MQFCKSEPFSEISEFVMWVDAIKKTRGKLDWIGVDCKNIFDGKFCAYCIADSTDSTYSLEYMNKLFSKVSSKLCTVYGNTPKGLKAKNHLLIYAKEAVVADHYSPIWIGTYDDVTAVAYLPIDGKYPKEYFSILPEAFSPELKTTYGIIPDDVVARMKSIYFEYKVGSHTSIPKMLVTLKDMNATWVAIRREFNYAGSTAVTYIVSRFDRARANEIANVGRALPKAPAVLVFELLTGTPESELITYEGCEFKPLSETIYDERGFNLDGFNIITESPFDEDGFSINGMHRDTGTLYDLRGFNTRGIHIITKRPYDDKGFDYGGHDSRGFDKDGIHEDTLGLYDKDGYDKDGYNEKGVNKNGICKEDFFDKDGINNITKTEFNENGIDVNGYDYNGFSKTTKRHLNGTLYDESGYNARNENSAGENRYVYRRLERA